MTSQLCIPQVQVCAVRVTAEHLDGSVIVGASTSYITDAMVTVTKKPVYKAGTEIQEDNGCGSSYVDYLSPASFTRDDIDFDFLTLDPNLLSIMLSQGAVLTSGGATGFAGPPIGTVSGQCSVELWTKRINAGILDPTFPYAHHVFPYVNNLQQGNETFDNKVNHLLLTGQAYENTNWFDGPANDWPVASNRTYQWLPTATLPVATCAFSAVAS